MEQALVRHGIPVKDLLLLLGADAAVSIKHLQEFGAGLFERCVNARLEVS